jgi:hypothetical protein
MRLDSRQCVAATDKAMEVNDGCLEWFIPPSGLHRSASSTGSTKA